MVILGAKGFAKEVLEILTQNEYDSEILFFDNVSTDVPSYLFNKFKVLKSWNELEDYFSNVENTFTIGMGNPINRKKLYDSAFQLGGKYSSTISPFARIGHFENIIEEGVNIMTGTIITNSIKIGKGSLLNLNCTVGHDSQIGEFVECSPGVNISGNCTIGRFSNIGTNAIILPQIRVGANVVIGAGAVVTKDLPDNCVAVGMPAEVKRILSPPKFSE